MCFPSWRHETNVSWQLKIRVVLISLVSRMGYQTALLARDKIHPDIRHHVNGLAIRHVRPIAPEPHRIHRLSFQSRIARDNVKWIDGTGMTHHYLEHNGLGSMSLLLQRKVWAHHGEAGRGHGCRRDDAPSGRRQGSSILQERTGKRRNSDQQSRHKNIRPDESRAAFC